jgi:hypothetical protein
MLTGVLTRVPDGWVSACDPIGAFGEGATREEAAEMLANCVFAIVGRDDLEVTVTETGPIDENTIGVFIDSNLPGVLAAYLLMVQRDLAGLSLADVAERLGAASGNAYAAYEKGEREPSISKLRELLAAVNPDLVLAVSPRHVAGHACLQKGDGTDRPQ